MDRPLMDLQIKHGASALGAYLDPMTNLGSLELRYSDPMMHPDSVKSSVHSILQM